MLTITIPTAEPPKGGYISQHCDVQLDRDQARTLRRIVEGLDRQQATTKNGKRVLKPADAVRWMLENLTDTSPQGAQTLGTQVPKVSDPKKRP